VLEIRPRKRLQEARIVSSGAILRARHQSEAPSDAGADCLAGSLLVVALAVTRNDGFAFLLDSGRPQSWAGYLKKPCRSPGCRDITSSEAMTNVGGLTNQQTRGSRSPLDRVALAPLTRPCPVKPCQSQTVRQSLLNQAIHSPLSRFA
jgi:hypothetical protein